MKFDELNQLKRFFSGMRISEDEQKKRVAFADLIYDAFFYAFTMMKIEIDIEERVAKEKDITPKQFADIVESYRETLENRIYDAFEGADLPHDDDYVSRLIDEVIDTTKKHPDEEFYLSADRAVLIGQNAANALYNAYNHEEAKKAGAKHKIWQSEGDERVRLNHAMIDGAMIPIDEYFIVGGEQMLFPCDGTFASPDNILNCRCTCLYI